MVAIFVRRAKKSFCVGLVFLTRKLVNSGKMRIPRIVGHKGVRKKNLAEIFFRLRISRSVKIRKNFPVPMFISRENFFLCQKISFVESLKKVLGTIGQK